MSKQRDSLWYANGALIAAGVAAVCWIIAIIAQIMQEIVK